jgi:hypothetical protein
MSDDPRIDRLDHNVHAPSLFDTRDGSIVHCACCGRIQIDFRGLTLLTTVDEFDTLCRTVAGAWEAVQEQDDARAWRLSAETDTGNVSVTLQLGELQALRRLLNGAYAMMTLRDSLTAVANGAQADTTVDAADDATYTDFFGE